MKLGGILSPILFAIYIDELFCRLQKSGFGCYIGNLFAGCFGYANDITLLAPSICALKLMMSIVDEYGLEYCVLFNPDKCQLISYVPHNQRSIDGIHHDKVFIKNNTSAVHVGNLIGPNIKHQDVYNVTNKFISSVNHVTSVFSKCHSHVKQYLFQTYCMPLYGAILWDLSSDKIEYFFTQWRKSIRKLWQLPYTTHSKLMYLT